MALGTAIKAFFAALTNGEKSKKIDAILNGSSEAPKIEPKKATPPKPAAPVRSEAPTLLSTLQREARLLDLVQEPLDQFEDAQIGAAAREVLRDSKKVLDRLFEIQPLADGEEGSQIDVPERASPNKFRPVGGESGTGTVAHRGWKASKCELPKWTGNSSEAKILAPTEVEIG